MQALVQATNKGAPEAPKLFEEVSQLADDPNMPLELRELGKVLQQYMSGVKNPDLSNLPEEIRQIVQKAFEESGEGTNVV